MPSTAPVLTRPNSAPAPAPRAAGSSSQPGFAAQVEPLMRAANDASSPPAPRAAPPKTSPPTSPPATTSAKLPAVVPGAPDAVSTGPSTAYDAGEGTAEPDDAETAETLVPAALPPEPALPALAPAPLLDTGLAAAFQPRAIVGSPATPPDPDLAGTDALDIAEPGPSLPPGLPASLAAGPGSGRIPNPAGRTEPQTRATDVPQSANEAVLPGRFQGTAAPAKDASPAAAPTPTLLTADAGPVHPVPKAAAEPLLPAATPDAAIAAALQSAAPTPAPGPAADAETAAPAPPSRPHPIAQLAPTFTAIAQPGDATAPKSLVIRLDPAELGHVQVRIDRSTGSPARVELIVERTDTLMMLLQDRPRLDQALNQAGVPPEGRTLQFNLGSQDQGTREHAGHARPASATWPGGSQSAEPPTITPTVRWQRAGIDITA